MKRKPIPRTHTIIRDLNQLVRDPDERVSEAKVWSNVGKFTCGYILFYHTDVIILHWDALAILLICMIAPDLLKKIITMKYQGATGGKN